MTPTIVTAESAESERRRVERRRNASIVELTLPELRRIIITTVLGAVVMALFLWMVRSVLIAALLGVIIGFYVRPLFLWLCAVTARSRLFGRQERRPLAGVLTLALITLPILGIVVYSYLELADVVGYAATHQDEIVAKVDAAVQRLPFFHNARAMSALGAFVANVTAYGTRLPLVLKTALSGFSIASAIFLFTAFYILMEQDKIAAYLASKIPPRYDELRGALEHNVRGVLYGAIYSTLITQTAKSLLILAMNLAFRVPLAGSLAVVSFVIGFFPIVGSWSVYLPVAIWLAIFRDAPWSGLVMFLVGMVVNTLFISNYLRPKIAASRSGVLNFYWMFIALITGVYTFGLPGILIGPILIGLLKAIVDTVTAGATWKLIETGEDGGGSSSVPG